MADRDVFVPWSVMTAARWAAALVSSSRSGVFG
jgi:hypothetical protein